VAALHALGPRSLGHLAVGLRAAEVPTAQLAKRLEGEDEHHLVPSAAAVMPMEAAWYAGS
jgi:hypothetical protein